VTLFLFPSLPFSPSEIDPDFAEERSAARDAGFETALVDHTRVMRGDSTAAVGAVPPHSDGAIYRGWMLTPPQYADMYAALEVKGATLRTSREAYRACHHLPDSYPFIEGSTPKSVWIPLDGAVDFDAVAELLAPFGGGPLILKDYVKSQKHYWNEACFIAAANDRDAVERVVRRFLELQGDELNVGLVFREFVPLRIIGKHPKSGMPLAAEFRTFWMNGEPILSHRYWGDLTTFDVALPWATLRPLALRIPSPFFTMDVALLDSGQWTIVELGDGQVAGLPSLDLAPAFFQKIQSSIGK
jgi:hypothetical protein